MSCGVNEILSTLLLLFVILAPLESFPPLKTSQLRLSPLFATSDSSTFGGRNEYFTSLKAWVGRELTSAKALVDDQASLINVLMQETPRSPELRKTENALIESKARLDWLEKVDAKSRPARRFSLTTMPKWSFAGDLLDKAREIELEVSREVSVDEGFGTKSSLPFVYISYPPRHGKSLLLDTLFRTVPAVCVLTATYNSATVIRPEESQSVKGALCGLFLRFIHDLIDGNHARGTELWMAHCPLVELLSLPDADAVPAIIATFEDMLGLRHTSAPASLLLTVDEISKFTDAVENLWHSKPSEQRLFWQSLFSLTRGTSPHWIRIAMTGFTDNPRIGSSDISCVATSLSMITTAEQELLAAELLWAHAVCNRRFPGLLWALVKSTPGLLGVWAEQIRLQDPLDSIDPREAMSLDYAGLLNAELSVPWVSTLTRLARRNWAAIRQFLIEDGFDGFAWVSPFPDTQRQARNFEVATVLGGRSALSPFAVAITVLALTRDPPLLPNGEIDSIFRLLSGAVQECARHSAGCAADMSIPWPHLVQAGLQKAKQRVVLESSPILQGDVRLDSLSPPLSMPAGGWDVQPRASVNNIGEPLERFVVQALALQLECVRLRVKNREPIPAGAVLPLAVGYLRRPPARPGCLLRHEAELNVALAVFTQPDEDLARLCTQTAALMLPSTVRCILDRPVIDTSISAALHLEASKDPPDLLRDILFDYDKVYVAIGPREVPKCFPVVQLDPNSDFLLHEKLVDELVSVAASVNSPRGVLDFDHANFCSGHALSPSGATQVLSVKMDVLRVADLAERAVRLREAVVFKPRKSNNPLCDVVAIVPLAALSAEDEAKDRERGSTDQDATVTPVCFVFLELLDKLSSNFGTEKLDKFVSGEKSVELLLGPVTEELKRRNVRVALSVLTCCSRNVVKVGP